MKNCQAKKKKKRKKKKKTKRKEKKTNKINIDSSLIFILTEVKPPWTISIFNC